MSDRAQIAKAAATGLRKLADQAEQNRVIVGFDGFVDSIIKVVDKRQDADHFTPMNTISQFADKVAAASGQSANYEWVCELQKLGGNGPIMANALCSAGLPTTYIGALGYPNIHEVFSDFASKAEVYSIANPGLTNALEFEDGKLMMGLLQTLKDVNWERLVEAVGRDKLVEMVSNTRLIGGTNWTMLPRMNDIFHHLIEDILPQAKTPAGGERHVFFDLADPEKRTSEDLLEGLQIIARFEPLVRTTLGLNLKESSQVADVLGIQVKGDPASVIETTAAAIREKLNVYCVVIHPRDGAAAARLEEGQVVTASFKGPFVKKPKLSTGAGDNFNAGFCLGLLAGLSLEQTLCSGTGTSGFYVRNAHSPSLNELADFCDALPDPQ